LGGVIAASSAEDRGKEATTVEIAKGIAIGAAIGVSAAGLGLSTFSAPSIIKYGINKAMFLGASSVSVFALGNLAYNVMPMILLPLLGMEGEALEYPEPYNTKQPK
jgi:hypothetical protein